MSIPTAPPDYSKLEQLLTYYINYFTKHRIDRQNIQLYSTKIKKSKNLIQEADRRCIPTKEQKRLAQWQKHLRDLNRQLVYALPDEKLIAKMDSSPDNTNNTDNTGNPYFVQFLNT